MITDAVKLGIAGLGMVGSPLKRYFEELRGYRRGENLFLYDVDSSKGYLDDLGRADIIFICVPSPRSSSGSADLSIVKSAIREIKGNKVIVIKSTIPPGTTEEIQKTFPHHKILFNPEFLTEAHAWKYTISPDRQFVGYTQKSRDVAGAVLSCLPQAPVMAPSEALTLTATEAEIIKYSANLFLARKVTFANAIYDLSRHHGADYEKISSGIAFDSRIGPSHLNVHHGGYRGYGGYCFVKDTDALISHCTECGLNKVAAFFQADRSFNESLLATQGLTPEDVSVHDHEWIQKKLKVESGK